MGCAQSTQKHVATSPPTSSNKAVGSHHSQSNAPSSAKTGDKGAADKPLHSANETEPETENQGYNSDNSMKNTNGVGNRGRFESYGSGADTPDSEEDNRSQRSGASSGSVSRRSDKIRANGSQNPKTLGHSTSAIGLDEMIEDRREVGDLRQNVVHIEVPFGKPIEEVYEGVHNGPVLGSGISGLVRLVTHKATGLKYAVKVLDLGLVDTAEGLRQLREEIFIMCQLDHPNIVRLEEVYESHSEIYLVQELCLGGELFDRLDEQPDYHYTEGECARLIKQMLSAVRYLHSKGIIHRDLKLENFLFSSTATDSELKMIDFGLSKHFRYGEIQHEAVGTPYTVAPEVIRGSYDERCDIWAIGVITFLLLSGDPPFGGCGGPEPLLTVRSNILKGQFSFQPEDIWANVSQQARAFIKALLVIDPKRRPTAREAQKHAWLQEWASRSRRGNDNVLNPNVVKALVNFKEFSDMRKLLCEVLSFTLLPDQIKDLRREFEKMDTDGSGEISLGALKQVLMTNAGAGSLGALTEEEVTDIFDAMRVRKTETRIHWHEFIAAGLSQCQVDDRNLRLAFDRLDSDHKGYITLDDIMDLMGSDALQSEDAMHRMWGDSIKAVKCQHARITYGDFLLLMKGQTKDTPVPMMKMDENASSLHAPIMKLPVVHESDALSESGDEKKIIEVPDAESPGLEQVIAGDRKSAPPAVLHDSTHTPERPVSPAPMQPKSCPTTPADHRRILDVEEIDSPTSSVHRDHSGPGIPGTAASLTPPLTPERGINHYVTPMDGRRIIGMGNSADGIMLPGLPPKPDPYVRRRSRSVGDEEEDVADVQDLHVVADAVRDMLLPETAHQLELELAVKDKTKTVLQVNRKLYRAHRQMRLAVLEASKRFEEQQARHARDVILAKREEEEGTEQTLGMIQAGLVMRHGHKKQVSSEAVRALLQQNRVQQQALIEKANRFSGRGRRSRKKTISDMSGMLSSLGQDELGAIAIKAANSESFGEGQEPDELAKARSGEAAIVTADAPDLSAVSKEGHMRKATVPGEFRSVNDPFSKRGKYGAVYGAPNEIDTPPNESPPSMDD